MKVAFAFSSSEGNMLRSFFLLFFLCEGTANGHLQLVATPDYPVAEGQIVRLQCSNFLIPNSGNFSWQHLKNESWQEVGREGRDLTLSKPEESGVYRCRSPWGDSPDHAVYIVSTQPTANGHLQLEATPDYPVAEGQIVRLQCSNFLIPNSGNFSWQHLKNESWQEVGRERDLTLSKPEESGVYRCRSPWGDSLNHTVYIVSMQPTVGEKLGIAAFVLTLLGLIINLAVLIWIGWIRLSDTMTTSKTAAEGFPGPEKSPKGGLQQTDSDGDVYMNYSNTNEAYSDLDPASMTDANVYSSLS